MDKLYKFKRNFYYELEEALENTNVSFLLGPRKCGKTVCLKQYNYEHKNVEYVDFKTIAEDEDKMSIFDKIIDSIKSDENIVYLLDEITYAFRPESEISKVAEAYSDIENSNTKVVFTGSQSVALEAWANRAFCGNASFIRTNFLSYAEWLRYKNSEEITADTYRDFLYEVKDFYKFTTLRDYLNGCLEETVLSNYKTNNIVLNNDVSELNADILLDVLYSTLLTRQNKTTPQVFANRNQLRDDIRYFFRDIFNGIGKEEIESRITSIFAERYNSLKSTNANTIRQALLFLHRCDLISLTYVTDDINKVLDVRTDLFSSENKINYKAELFEKVIVCIRYPMFYIEILKDVLKEKMPQVLPQDILGGIVECHVRGILPEKNSCEYHDKMEREVDYVNTSKQLAVEISVANKKNKNVHFDSIPNDYINVLLTKDIGSYNDGIYRIPYYVFIYGGINGVDLLVDQHYFRMINQEPLTEQTPININEKDNEQLKLDNQEDHQNEKQNESKNNIYTQNRIEDNMAEYDDYE